jgi:hypothetical protein
MSSVVISGDSSGAITLAAPAVAGTNTATLPAATGTVMVSGNMPAFSYVAATAQSITTATFTKVTLGTQVFDTTGGMFSSSRFTPAVAGYYQFNAILCIGNSTLTRTILNFYKNGSQYNRPFDDQISVTGTSRYINASSLIYCNGSTDYVELYTYLVGTGLTLSVLALNEVSTFSGVLVRSA